MMKISRLFLKLRDLIQNWLSTVKTWLVSKVPPPIAALGRWFTRLFRYWKFVTAALTAIVLAVPLYAEMRRSTIDIEPIAVPKQLTDRGLTPVVAAQRLRDAINSIVISTGSSMAGPEFMRSDPAFMQRGPEIVVRDVGFHPEEIAVWLGNRLHLRHQWVVSGEITISKDESQLSLRVRFNGNPFHNSRVGPSRGTDEESFDGLFVQPAAGILELTSPYLAAVACFTNDQTHQSIAREIADRIIATQRDGEEVARAHDLLAELAWERDYKKTKNTSWLNDTVEEYRKAIEAASWLSNPYRYRAWFENKQARAAQARNDVLLARIKVQQAKEDFQRAVQLAQTDADARNDFGDFLLEQNELDAIARNPKLDRAAARVLGIRHAKEAEEQYNNAIKIGQDSMLNDRSNARNYLRIGYASFRLSGIFKAKGEHEKTLEQLRKAFAALDRSTELDQTNIDANYDLILTIDELLRRPHDPNSEQPLVSRAWNAFVDLNYLLSKSPQSTADFYVEDREGEEYNNAITNIQKFDQAQGGDSDRFGNSSQFPALTVAASRILLKPCPRRLN